MVVKLKGIFPPLLHPLQERIMINAIRDVMYEAGPGLVAVIGMLELRGVCRTFPRAPFLPLAASAVESVRQKLIQEGPIGKFHALQ